MKMAKKNGMEVQRDIMSMYKGGEIVDRPECIWASSGPEKG